MSDRVRGHDTATPNGGSSDRLRSVAVPVVLLDVVAFVVGLVATAAFATFPAQFGFLFGLSGRVILDDLGRSVRTMGGRAGTIVRVLLVVLLVAGTVALVSTGANGLVSAGVFGAGFAGIVMRFTRR